jgi:pimeloyl-ACP methyl ester carboxylesterase
MAIQLTRRTFLSLSVGTTTFFLSNKWLQPASAKPTASVMRSNQVQLHNGVTLNYVENQPSFPDSDTIIFLHGYTDSWRAFERNLPLLSNKFRILAIDQRGHGNSSLLSCCYTQADFAADIDAFMTAVKIEKATLVGHSMGGFIAHKVAVDYPQRVQRLVLIGAAPSAVKNPILKELNDTVQALVEPIDLNFVREFQASTFYKPITPVFLDTAVAESLKVPLMVWKQTLAGLIVEDHATRLEQIAAPSLILWGDRDGIVTLQDQQTLQTQIPNSTLKIYRETGHGLHVESPQRFVRDLYRFMR